MKTKCSKTAVCIKKWPKTIKLDFSSQTLFKITHTNLTSNRASEQVIKQAVIK